MNDYLATLFNTDGYAEKKAYLENVTDAFVKTASEEGVDLRGYSPEEIVNMAEEWAGEVENPQAQEGFDPNYVEGPGNLGPKTSEVDFLGRYMAHAYHDELTKIASQTKTADARASILSEAARTGAGAVEKLPTALRSHLTEAGQGIRGAAKEVWQRFGRGRDIKELKGAIQRRVSELPQGGAETKDIGELRKALRSERLKTWGARAGVGATGLGVAGLGIHAATKKSHIQQLDDAALSRANQLLKFAEEGYDVTQEGAMNQDETDMDRVITELAWEKLREAGYVNE